MNWVPSTQWPPLSDHLIVEWPQCPLEQLGSTTKDTLWCPAPAISYPWKASLRCLSSKTLVWWCSNLAESLQKHRVGDQPSEFPVQLVKSAGLRFCFPNSLSGDRNTIGLRLPPWKALPQSKTSILPFQTITFPVPTNGMGKEWRLRKNSFPYVSLANL